MPEVKREGKLALTHRLQREGRWGEATAFKDEVIAELRQAGMVGHEAKRIAWAEMGRRYPPLEEEPKVKEEVENEEEAEEVPAAEAEAIEKMLEELAPVDLVADIRWVYSQLANKRVRPDQAPSAGAWGLLQHARKYSKAFFEQLLPKALAKAPDEEAGIKQEKRRMEEIKEMIRTIDEEEL